MSPSIITEGLVDSLIKISLLAGESILKTYRNSQSFPVKTELVSHKFDLSPLTTADIRSHNIIVTELDKLDEKFLVISEENYLDLEINSLPDIYWLVDPLDGTKEFLTGTDEFTVNICLIKLGEPVFGIIYAPALDELYYGGVDFGSFSVKNKSKTVINCLPWSKKNRQTILVSRSHLNKRTEEFIASFSTSNIFSIGSSLKFCRIAEGVADLYPRLAPTYEWDTAAAQAILEGAGGYVCDLNGNRLLYGKTEILNPSFIAGVAPVSSWIGK